MQNNTFSVEGLFDFLNAGVSAFHSTAAAVKILEENGYQNCPESAAWELVPGGRYYTTRISTIPSSLKSAISVSTLLPAVTSFNI